MVENKGCEELIFFTDVPAETEVHDVHVPRW